jgi:hypothetical protein
MSRKCGYECSVYVILFKNGNKHIKEKKQIGGGGDRQKEQETWLVDKPNNNSLARQGKTGKKREWKTSSLQKIDTSQNRLQSSRHLPAQETPARAMARGKSNGFIIFHCIFNFFYINIKRIEVIQKKRMVTAMIVLIAAGQFCFVC